MQLDFSVAKKSIASAISINEEKRPCGVCFINLAVRAFSSSSDASCTSAPATVGASATPRHLPLALIPWPFHAVLRGRLDEQARFTFARVVCGNQYVKNGDFD